MNATNRDSTCVLKAKPGKLDFKRHKFISLQVGLLFILAIMTYYFLFSCQFNVIQKVQRHDDLIKANA